MIEDGQCYYLIPGTIVQVLREDPRRHMSLMRMGSVTRSLWTYTRFLSRHPVQDTSQKRETFRVLSNLLQVSGLGYPCEKLAKCSHCMLENLKLTSVGGPASVSLPNLDFVSETLGVQLENVGMSKPESKVTNDFTPRDRNQSDPPYSLDALRESQTDVLGLYWTDRSKAEITLYVDSCMRASKDLSVPLDHLLQVVLIHEIAHHVTAWAIIKPSDDEYQYSWSDCNDCLADSWTSVHEFFAQASAFVCITERDEALLDTFRKLSRNQSSVYRTWEVLDASPRTRSALTRFVIHCGASS